MARGFWTGAVHGAALGAAGLALVSLLAPMPRPGDAAPDADAVGLPVGSEFGRGGDVAPRLPADVSETVRQSEPMAVRAPVAEPAPVRTPADNARPEAPAGSDGPVQTSPDATGEAPALDLPAAPQATPTESAAPRPDMAAAPDSLPASPEGAGNVVPDPPALPQPSLDLSLPPDLSDLPGMDQP